MVLIFCIGDYFHFCIFVVVNAVSQFLYTERSARVFPLCWCLDNLFNDYRWKFELSAKSFKLMHMCVDIFSLLLKHPFLCRTHSNFHPFGTVAKQTLTPLSCRSANAAISNVMAFREQKEWTEKFGDWGVLNISYTFVIKVLEQSSTTSDRSDSSIEIYKQAKCEST